MNAVLRAAVLSNYGPGCYDVINSLYETIERETAQLTSVGELAMHRFAGSFAVLMEDNVRELQLLRRTVALQQMAMQHAMALEQRLNAWRMQQIQALAHQQQQLNAGGLPRVLLQPPAGYWYEPIEGERGGFRGCNVGGGQGESRSHSREYRSRNNSIASGRRGEETEESWDCSTPNEDEIWMEGEEGGHHTAPSRSWMQLLGLADPESSPPPTEPLHSAECCVTVPQEGHQERWTTVPVPSRPRTELGKELLKMLRISEVGENTTTVPSNAPRTETHQDDFTERAVEVVKKEEGKETMKEEEAKEEVERKLVDAAAAIAAPAAAQETDPMQQLPEQGGIKIWAPANASEEELCMLLSHFGRLLSFSCSQTRWTKIALAQLQSDEAADAAVAALHGRRLGRGTMRVERAERPQRDRAACDLLPRFDCYKESPPAAAAAEVGSESSAASDEKTEVVRESESCCSCFSVD
ncbi:hypothetical protein PMAYCL1PPCAC_08717 [Pristionchus mayeri]|uniref:RRM domain-containing protein n=1 Tax=Pristionchus mayeri TaxID=1317129 RepID=A0AAN5CCN6_9BILA|nr:hypothetical protein PMAYCL1PPCAC_08717 [Pristionchus mayeri]